MKEQSATYRITDLDQSERPRERLAKHGPQVLSNAELLAILLRVGVPGENAVQMGQRLLKDLQGLRGPPTGGLPGGLQPAWHRAGQGGADQSRHRAGTAPVGRSAGRAPIHPQPWRCCRHGAL